MKKSFLFLTANLLILALFLSDSFAQNYTKWDLPNGATARYGKGWIQDLQFAPFDNELAVATTIGVWLYDTRTGKEKALLSGVMGGANAVAYSPGGLLLASAHEDQTIRVWNLSNLESKKPKPQTILRGHTGTIYAITFSPDGSLIASGSADNSIRIWDPHTPIDKEKLHSILPYKDVVNTVAFSPDSHMIAGGSRDGVIQVWDAGTGDHMYDFTDHTDAIWEVDFSPGGTILASASSGGAVQLWDLVDPGGKHAEPTQYRSAVYTVNFSEDGNNFASGGADQQIYIRDTQTSELVSTLEGHEDIVRSIKFSPDDMTLASGSFDGTVRLWNRKLARERLVLAGHTGGVRALTYSEDNRLHACGTNDLDNKLRLWDAGTGSQIAKLREHRGLTQAVAFSKDGKRVASGGSESGTIFVSNTAAGDNYGDTLEAALEGNMHGITALTLSPAETTIASGGADGRIYLMDVSTGTVLKVFRGAQSTITALTFFADANHLFSGEANGTVRRWDASTGEEIWEYSSLLGAITALTFSGDGRYLAIADQIGKIQLFDFAVADEAAPKMVTIEKSHTRKIDALVFTKDNTCVVSGSADGTIIIWDMEKIWAAPQTPSNAAAQSAQPEAVKQETPAQIAKRALQSTVFVSVKTTNGSDAYGSGFFVHPGYVVTNYHVIADAVQIYVKPVGSETIYSIQSIVAIDERHDLAVMKVVGLNLLPLPLGDSNRIQMGEDIYVIGNPKGYEGTFSKGVVSGIRGSGINTWIQMDAAISPGSSGGAVLNRNGQVIGIATLRDPSIDAQNLNFAVPSHYLQLLLRDHQ